MPDAMNCERRCGLHPSKSLGTRFKGFGIGGGYERPLRKGTGVVVRAGNVYGTVPPGGYYGGTEGGMPFEFGEAGFGCELGMYCKQYGLESVIKIKKP